MFWIFIFKHLKLEPDALVPALQGLTKEQRTAEQRKPYKERNLIKAHFDQKAVGKTNPLVLVKDFIQRIPELGLSQFISKPVTFSIYF